MTEVANDRFPWMWWPARPPDPRWPFQRDVLVSQAMWTIGWAVFGIWAAERALRHIDALPEGRVLWRDRVLQIIPSVLAWAETAGAWERRARRRTGLFR